MRKSNSSVSAAPGLLLLMGDEGITSHLYPDCDRLPTWSQKVLAARLHELGKPLEIEQVDVAAPGPGEVTIDLAFAGVNPMDRYVATGSVGAGNRLPRTIGGEGSGYLDGKPVLVNGEGLGVTRDGTFAGAVTCPREAVIEAGEGTDLRELAAMGVAGLTAWNVVTQSAQVTERDRVLVLGAGGGVGIPIVSVASSTGARCGARSAPRPRRLR